VRDIDWNTWCAPDCLNGRVEEAVLSCDYLWIEGYMCNEERETTNFDLLFVPFKNIC